MDCLYAECIPCITDCVLAELEKLGQKYRVALKVAKVGSHAEWLDVGCRAQDFCEENMDLFPREGCMIQVESWLSGVRWVLRNDKSVRPGRESCYGRVDGQRDRE